MARACSLAGALAIIGEKWALLAIRELFQGVRRFNEIQAATGAPRDILADRLRGLVEAGVVERRQYQEHPPRDEYYLTAAGHDLFAAVTTLREWGDAHCRPEGAPSFTHKCGNLLESQLVCTRCGEPVTERNVRMAEALR